MPIHTCVVLKEQPECNKTYVIQFITYHQSVNTMLIVGNTVKQGRMSLLPATEMEGSRTVLSVLRAVSGFNDGTVVSQNDVAH